MLKKMIAENWVEARAVFGLFPANTVNDDDIAVYADESRSQTLMTWHNLRQQMKKPEGRANLLPRGFRRAQGQRLKDYLGAFVVTAGIGEDERAKAFEAAHDDYSAILFKSLCDRLAEAFAEHLHLRVRREFWGYASEEALANDELIEEKYQGIRPAPGYPACPEHSEKGAAVRGARRDRRTSASCSPRTSPCGRARRCRASTCRTPTASISRWPNSRRDQVEDYARRKGWDMATAERWLAPNLAYQPD